jgi:hypothetical protein
MSMENATAFNISSVGCDYGLMNSNPFVSNNGLDIGAYPNQRGRTYFVNNVGLGDNYNPSIILSGIETRPASITAGDLYWTDVVGSYNWSNGYVWYSLEPFMTDAPGWKWDLNTSVTSRLYVTTGKDITYSWDFARGNDGKVYTPGILSMSAKFSRADMLYNPWTQDLGKVNLVRHTR